MVRLPLLSGAATLHCWLLCPWVRVDGCISRHEEVALRAYAPVLPSDPCHAVRCQAGCQSCDERHLGAPVMLLQMATPPCAGLASHVPAQPLLRAVHIRSESSTARLELACSALCLTPVCLTWSGYCPSHHILCALLKQQHSLTSILAKHSTKSL